MDKVYFAKVKGTLREDIVQAFAGGITLADQTTVLPAELLIESSYEEAGEPVCEARLTIHEGNSTRLKGCLRRPEVRLSFKTSFHGPLTLDPKLKPGESRLLTGKEIKALGRV